MQEFLTSDPEPKTESSSDLFSFHLFSRLPAELQFNIWEAAFDITSRFVNIRIDMTFCYDPRSTPSWSNMCITGGEFSTRGRETDKFRESHRLSLACCNAQKFYLLRYPKTIILAKPGGPEAGYIRIRCNPAHDILCIRATTGFSHDHNNRGSTALTSTQISLLRHLRSTRDILSSFHNVAILLNRNWEERRAWALSPPLTRLTLPYLTLFLFSFFESIGHLYFLVKPESSDTDDAVFLLGLPVQGYTPAPVQCFLDFYDLVQRASESDNFWCKRHRRYRPRLLREIQCYYSRQWLDKNSAAKIVFATLNYPT
jgi:hypothetical protein